MVDHSESIGTTPQKDNVSITEISQDEISQNNDTPYIDISLNLDEEELQRRQNSKWFQVKNSGGMELGSTQGSNST